MKFFSRFILGGLIVGLFIASLFFINPKRDIIETLEEFNALMEVEQLHIRGWDKRFLSWEVYASEAYNRSYDYMQLRNISNGKIFDADRKAILYELRAVTADIKLYNKEIVLKTFSGNISENKFNPKQRSFIKASTLKYIAAQKRAFLFGDISITNDDSTIIGKYAEINTESGAVEFAKGIKYISDDLVVSSQSLLFDFKNKFIKLVGNCQIKKGSDFLLNSQVMRIEKYKKNKEVIHFSKNVVFRHKDQKVEGSAGKYFNNSKLMYLYKPFKVYFDAKYAFSHSSDNLSLGTLEANEMRINFKDETLEFIGNLNYVQPDLIIKADLGHHDLKKNLLYLYGGVNIWQKNRSVNAESVVIDVAAGSFEAKGQIFSKITL